MSVKREHLMDRSTLADFREVPSSGNDQDLWIAFCAYFRKSSAWHLLEYGYRLWR